MKKVILFLLYIISCTLTAQPKYQSDIFSTKNGKKVTITFIKHGSLAITYDNISFQIDPVINYQDNVTDYSSFPKANFILVTHEHPDHYDEKAIRLLSKKSTQIILNESCKEKLGSGIAMKNGDKRSLKKRIDIEAVPAYNTTAGREKYHPKGRDNGYILTFDGLRIYIAGDTEDIPEMNDISNIDIAFLPINQPYTMTLEQAERAVRMISPKIFYPYHFNDTPVQELVTRLNNTLIEVRIREMK
ncbi:MBL fold metallo-hydrolase [Capnocytophaga catalasegens]|uniref:Metal-dependent hydrolase n=1 Tax=Capnocytophaga catalasegens TaxID=1004260 RepID=A0AAV5AYK4_9FLAO|nr:MBL fold metallo-hydrolase [Capnocytophaga catalasegens]GIZ16298.1 metal-dependent hydrolase [Capnocytophaga catalasegens]GJM50530.1 metal-dependent hydrolase [Capnocytophaga catalasegens]GJM53209.1 metal-dependent hydrolase [Capnocytophaga catalasegens]